MGEYLTIRKSSYLFSLTQFQKISHIKTFKLPIEPKLKYPNFKFSGDFSRFHQQMNIRCRRGYAVCNSEFIGQGRRRGRNKYEKYVDRIMFMIPIKKQLFEGVLKNNVSEKKYWKTSARESLLHRVQAQSRMETLAQVFLCQFYNNFLNCSTAEHLRSTAV